MIDNKRAMRLSDETYQIVLRNAREQKEFWERAIERIEREKKERKK